MLKMQRMRSPTRTLSGITITVMAGCSVFPAAADLAVRRLIGKVINSKKRSSVKNPAVCRSDPAFTIPKKRVQVANEGAIGIKEYRVDPHAPKP